MGNKPSLSAFLINDAVLPTTENFATTSNRVKFTIGPIPHCVSFYTDRLPTFSASPIFQDSQLILSQEHPSTFRLFAQWLSSGCIVTPSQSSVEKMVTYARAWVFGERYSVKGFQNAIAVELNEMIKVSSWEELRGLLGFLWDPFEGEPEGDTTILERMCAVHMLRNLEMVPMDSFMALEFAMQTAEEEGDGSHEGWEDDFLV